jgi:hypothetical protein
MPSEYYGRAVGRLRVPQHRPSRFAPVQREGDHAHVAMGLTMTFHRCGKLLAAEPIISMSLPA